ncbi:MAG: hypothetical protein N3G21_13230 [Candidatus Hydrogenedentes bacterium]|nr:hypothetical protein [Candidatus Hydrogenedentota bacterium]
MLKLIDLEKSERWLTKSERKQWRKKYEVLANWLKENDGELTPILQLRIKEFLFLFFITRRIEEEWIRKILDNPNSSEPVNLQGKVKIGVAQGLYLEYVEQLGKYYEKLRKLLQEFEDSITVNSKTKQGFSLAELLEDLIKCSKEIREDENKFQPAENT